MSSSAHQLNNFGVTAAALAAAELTMPVMQTFSSHLAFIRRQRELFYQANVTVEPPKANETGGTLHRLARAAIRAVMRGAAKAFAEEISHTIMKLIIYIIGVFILHR